MITIVDYGDSNANEVGECLKQLTDDFVISSKEIDICRSDKIIFPGTGKASSAMKQLHLLNLFSIMKIIKKPMLGIGLGMQLMAEYTMEGNIPCLGIFDSTAVKFNNEKTHAFNEGLQPIRITKGSMLFEGIKEDENFYFSHSYYLPVCNLSTSIAGNGTTFSSSVEKTNSFGVQFHPEKSGEAGLKLLKNFLNI